MPIELTMKHKSINLLKLYQPHKQLIVNVLMFRAQELRFGVVGKLKAVRRGTHRLGVV